MILVTLPLKVTPEKRSGVIGLFELFIGPVSVQPGCLSVNLYSNTSTNHLLLIEEWDSHTNLDRHIRSEQFRTILAIMDMADERPEISFRTISSTQDFELVRELRGQTPEFHEVPRLRD